MKRTSMLGLAASFGVAIRAFAAAEPAEGQPSHSDDYVRGCAVTLIREVFSMDRASVCVSNGNITVRCQYLDESEAANARRVLSRVPGVRSVRVELDAPHADSAGSYTTVQPTRYTLFPNRSLFRPLLADPRWPQVSVQLRNFVDNDEYEQLAGINLGASMPVWRIASASGHRTEIGVQAGVFSLFNPKEDETEMMNSDFVISLPVAYRYDHLAAMARLSHQSTHLGDEYIKHHGTNDIEKISFEFIDFLLSYDVHNNCRLYSGVSYRFAGKPDEYDPWALNLGFESRMRKAFFHGTTRPVVAFDILCQQENSWNSDLTTRLGVEIQSTDAAEYRFQILGEYYDGHMIDGQFYDDRVRSYGVTIGVMRR